jgi:hypothetical protein
MAKKALQNQKLFKGQLKMKITKLKQYIGLANMLPPDRYALDIELALALGSIPGAPRSPDVSVVELELKRFRFLLRYLMKSEIPSDLRKYILEGVSEKALQTALSPPEYIPDPGRFTQEDVSPEMWEEIRNPLPEIYSALRKYDEFFKVREKLIEIARLGKESTSIRISSSYLYCDEYGVLQERSDPFTETVKGLEANRIRECPVCKRLFWADRSDQKACTKACANLYRVRKSRTPEARQMRSENRKYMRQKAKRKNGGSK